MTTPKQRAHAHVRQIHGGLHSYKHWTLNQLLAWHAQDHSGKNFTHMHRSPDDMVNLMPVRISLSPPKNPGSQNRKDRNWVLNISHGNTGWRGELAGTFAGDPDGARAAANKILGYEALWAVCGWGFEVKDH